MPAKSREWRASAVCDYNQIKHRRRINGENQWVCVGESLVGRQEVAQIDLMIGPRGGLDRICHALTNNKDGFTSLLALWPPKL